MRLFVFFFQFFAFSHRFLFRICFVAAKKIKKESEIRTKIVTFDKMLNEYVDDRKWVNCVGALTDFQSMYQNKRTKKKVSNKN